MWKISFFDNRFLKTIGFKILILLVFIIAIDCKSENEDLLTVSNEGILKVSSDGVFMRNNKPFYGIGINYFDGFYRTIKNQSDKSYKDGLRYLGKSKIPFIRFSANGFWANELKLYQSNKARYFELLDEFVNEAEVNGIGLIPSLFWFYAAVPDLVGEHLNQWGNPTSKTIAFMRTYTEEMVKRYKNSPAIWAWEFGNEVNSYVDLLDQAINFLPVVSVSQGTPAKRTEEDIITTDILRIAMNEFITVVRKYDPDRAIFSGNTMPEPNMYHRYNYQNWQKDSSTDYTALLDIQNPVGLRSLTIHIYPKAENKYFTDKESNLSQIIQESMRSSKELKRPLFVGEFGSPKTLGTEMESQKFDEMINAIVDNEVQLSALWVFDFSYQDTEWNITSTNNRKYQLEEIIKLNASFRNENKQ